ncbi:methuselah-like protein 10 [Elysia marginata]|uniref:Methuselah-like protein 10 n=1 Tax=Elysia marginata TaxID=1093978 RepID=A0AAV4F1M7_9GAST|nr:methuselah-like protein 10 [Elysia marginata]
MKFKSNDLFSFSVLVVILSIIPPKTSLEYKNVIRPSQLATTDVDFQVNRTGTSPTTDLNHSVQHDTATTDNPWVQDNTSSTQTKILGLQHTGDVGNSSMFTSQSKTQRREKAEHSDLDLLLRIFKDAESNRTSQSDTDLTPKSNNPFIFAGVDIIGCEAAMRCTHVCDPTPKDLNRGRDNEPVKDSVVTSINSLPKSRRRRDTPRHVLGVVKSDNDFRSSLESVTPSESPELFKAGETIPEAISTKASLNQKFYFGASNTRDLTRHRRGTTQSVPSFNCKCDPICVDFGDCCVDTIAFCFDLLHKDEEGIQSFFINRSKNVKPKNFSKVTLDEALESHSDVKEVYYDYLAKYGACVRADTFSGYRVISYCPQGFSDEKTVDDCESKRYPLLPPVSVALRSNVYFPFKNAYCARCHGLQRSKLVAWEPSVLCDSNTEILNKQGVIDFEHLSKLVLNESCQVHFKPAELIGPLRTCQPGFDVTSDLKADVDYGVANNVCTPAQAMLCMTYVVPMPMPLLRYRNDHCLKCTSHTGPNFQRKRRDASTGCSDDSDRLLTPDNARPSGGVLVLLDITGRYSLSADGVGSSSGQDPYFCKDDQKFDPIVLSCEDFTCREGSEPYRGVCVITDGVYLPASSQLFPDQWNTFSVSISHTLPSDGKVLDCENLLGRLHSSKNFMEQERLFDMVKNVSIRSYGHFFEGKERHISGQIRNEGFQCLNQYFQSEDGESFQEIYALLASARRDYEHTLSKAAQLSVLVVESFLKENGTVKLSTIDTSFSSPVCPDLQIKTKTEEFSLRTHKGIEYATINASGISFNFPLMSVGFDRVFEFYRGRIDTNGSKNAISVCLKSDIFAWKNCSVTTYSKTEIKYVMNSSKIRVLKSGREFEKHQVYETEDQILVCEDITSISKPFVPRYKPQTDEIYKKLNWVCSSISIVFLCIMLVMYRVFPELLTLPGRLIACLAATMMLTFAFNLFTLVDLHHNIMCPIAAVTAHFVTLAQYGWMSAIAVNMSLTFGFSTVRCQSEQEARRLFRRYSVVVWGTSALIVATSLILDLTHNEVNNFMSQTFPDTENLSLLKPVFFSNTTEVYFQDEISSNFASVLTTDAEDITERTTTGSTSSTFDSTNRKDNFPRYGYPFCSWFSGPLWTRLAFVLIPYGLTLAVDAVGFAVTVRGIITSARASAKTLDRQVHTRSQVVIFLKLSTTMGVSWAISVFFTVSESQVLVYLYTSLVLLQGFLLFLAFMVNKRVLTLIQKRCVCTSRWLYKVNITKLWNSSSNISNVTGTETSEVRSSSQQ